MEDDEGSRDLEEEVEDIREKYKEMEEEDGGMSRRKFLKVLGLGASGFALTSSASAVNFFNLNENPRGAKGLENDEFDSSSLGREVKVDETGNMQNTTAGTTTGNITTTFGTTKITTTTSERAVFHTMYASGVDGSATFYRNGNQVATATMTATNDQTTKQFEANTASPTWSAKFSQTTTMTGTYTVSFTVKRNSFMDVYQP